MNGVLAHLPGLWKDLKSQAVGFVTIVAGANPTGGQVCARLSETNTIVTIDVELSQLRMVEFPKARLP